MLGKLLRHTLFMAFLGVTPLPAQVLLPQEMTEENMATVLAAAQERIDDLQAAATAVSNGEATAFWAGESDRQVVAVDNELLDQMIENTATYATFVAANIDGFERALANRIAQAAREAASNAAREALESVPGARHSPGVINRIASGIGSVADMVAGAAVSSAGPVTQERLAALIRQRVEQGALSVDQINAELAGWQEAYDTLDALMNEYFRRPPEGLGENCHADHTELSRHRLLEDWDLFIGDFNSTGRYIQWGDNLYCEVNGQHFYLASGDLWQRWVRHRGEWVLDSYLEITERDGRDSQNRRVMTGWSRRVGEERRRNRYTITYPN